MPDSWSHRAVRPLVPALIRARVSPNQVTVGHLAVGLIAVAAVAWGSPAARLAGGLLWVVSCLLDRLDGELARIGDMCSPEGAKLDEAVDRWTGALFLLGLGLSLHAGPHAWLGAGCGGLAFAAQQGNCLVADRYDALSPSGDKVIPSWRGFDADDGLYLLAPLPWLPADVRLGAVALAAVATLGFLAAFSIRLARLRRRLARSVAIGQA